MENDKQTKKQNDKRNNLRTVELHFRVTQEEAARIRKRIAESGIKREAAYFRKMALDGYMIQMDLSGVKEMIRLLRINSNNLNQYARVANECGSSMRKTSEICRRSRRNSGQKCGRFWKR